MILSQEYHDLVTFFRVSETEDLYAIVWRFYLKGGKENASLPGRHSETSDWTTETETLGLL